MSYYYGLSKESRLVLIEQILRLAREIIVKSGKNYRFVPKEAPHE